VLCYSQLTPLSLDQAHEGSSCAVQWRCIDDEDPMLRATHPYPQMSIAAICALDVPSIAAPDSILWLWTPNYHLVARAALEVAAAWGFKPKTLVTWVKERMVRGERLRGQTEQCIMAVRGTPIVTRRCCLCWCAARPRRWRAVPVP
jgi:N6-adenosine-specific RNA methylase IME4